MNINIREATFYDQDDILTILNEVSAELKRKGIDQWQERWSPLANFVELHHRRLYVVTLDEKIVGTFGIKGLDTLVDLSIEPGSKYLYHIAILPEYQGQGIGAQITAFAKRLAKPAIYLDCWAGNEKLKDFYGKMGFEYLGDHPEKDYYISIFKYNKHEE